MHVGDSQQQQDPELLQPLHLWTKQNADVILTGIINQQATNSLSHDRNMNVRLSLSLTFT